jgi:putative transcriptional regulator
MAEPRLTNMIRTLRFHAGEMTQAELGERIGVTRQTVAAIEQGKYSPTLETAFKIADVFEVRLDDVFQWSEHGATALEAHRVPDPKSEIV